MVASALIATQLTDHSSRVVMLTIAGVDVNGQVGAGGNGYHVPIGSIAVDEQGPGGISTLRFDLVDPLATGPVPRDGDEVVRWDIVNDIPSFAGFVSNWKTLPLPSGQGRVTSISCSGYEVILDWALIPFDLTIPAGTTLQAAIQLCAGVAEGTRELRAFSADSGTGTSSQALPITRFATGFHGAGGVAALAYAITIVGGTSLREALYACAQAAAFGAFPGPDPSNAQFTVDFYRGLRAYSDSAAGAWAEYSNLTVSDTVAGANPADGLEHETDATQIVRGVFIKGANAAGTGFLGDGTGKPGKVAFISDSTIDTAAKLLDAQTTYLNQFVIATRGSFDLVDWTPTSTVLHPGSMVVLTDAQANATGSYRIYGLSKRFLKSGRETWVIQYGGLRPSANRLLRRLTRPIRS